MSKELYVGSLSYDATEYELEKLFSVSGRVTSIHLITDLTTGKFMGCGYVRMSTEAEAKDAIASLDGAWFLDKRITVSVARPQKQRPQPGGYKGKTKTGGFAQAGGAADAKPARPAASKPGGAKTGTSRPAGMPTRAAKGKK